MDAVGTQPLPVEVHGASLSQHVGFTFNPLMLAFGVYKNLTLHNYSNASMNLNKKEWNLQSRSVKVKFENLWMYVAKGWQMGQTCVA